MVDPGVGHGGADYFVAPAGRLAVGQPTHGHHLFAQEGEAQGGALRQHADPVGQSVVGPPPAGLAEQVDLPFMFQLAGQALEQ